MKRSILGAVIAGAGITLAGIATAPVASAYPVGPYGIQGPCAGKTAAQCPMSPSPDGLTWAFHGNAWNYDKTGAFVCMTQDFYCDPLMAAVRALPPTPIGDPINSLSADPGTVNPDPGVGAPCEGDGKWVHLDPGNAGHYGTDWLCQH